MKILPYSTQKIDDSDISAVLSALKEPLLTKGNKVIEFEKQLANYCGAKFALAFNSATSALKASYFAHNLQNCAVLTSPISFVATTNMLLESGYK